MQKNLRRTNTMDSIRGRGWMAAKDYIKRGHFNGLGFEIHCLYICDSSTGYMKTKKKEKPFWKIATSDMP